MSERTCPVGDCSTPIRRDLLMCAPHWKRVPRPLQEQVYAAWRGYKTNPAEWASRLVTVQRSAIAEARR